MIRSSFLRIALVSVAMSIPFVGASSASAAVFCVGDAACVAGGGADSSLAAAFSSSNSLPDADTIRIGAGTFEVSGVLTANSLRPVTIVGGGVGVTTLHAGVGTAIQLLDGESSISSLTVDNDNTGGSALVIENLTFPRDVENVHDIVMTGDGQTGITATGEVRIARVDVRLRTADVGGSSFGIVVNTRASKVARISDSSVRATNAILISGTGQARVSGVSVVYSLYGVTSGVGGLNDNLTVYLTGITTVYKEEASVAFEDAAIRATTSGGTTGAMAVHVYSFNSTHIAPSTGAPAANVYNISATGGSAAGTTNGAITAKGSIAHGPFTRAAFVNQNNNGNNTAILNITRSSIDVSGFRLDAQNGSIAGATAINFVADPKFVDVAGGDFHLRHDSPLLDAGVTTNEAWEDGLDRDRRARPVWKDGSSAPSPLHDFGAYEYHRLAPSAAILGAGTVTPGTPIALSGLASDPNAGETSTLTYAWTLPGGAGSAASNVSIAAPAADGIYPITLVVTDVTGLASVAATATLTVATPKPPVVVTPRDTLAPTLKFTPVKGRLPLLLKRSPLVAKFTLDEAADVKVSLVATITLPPLRKGKPKRKVTAVLATTSLTHLAGTRSIKLVPTVTGVKRFVALSKLKGAKVTGWAITATARDAARNTRAVRAVVAVAAR